MTELPCIRINNRRRRLHKFYRTIFGECDVWRGVVRRHHFFEVILSGHPERDVRILRVLGRFQLKDGCFSSGYFRKYFDTSHPFPIVKVKLLLSVLIWMMAPFPSFSGPLMTPATGRPLSGKINSIFHSSEW